MKPERWQELDQLFQSAVERPPSERAAFLELLGVGGRGEVYLAEDTTLGRKVALKLLPTDFARDIERVRRFQQEAHAASALNHPNIITIYEIAHIDDRHLIATEFIDGETLRERIRGSRSQTCETLRHLKQ